MQKSTLSRALSIASLASAGFVFISSSHAAGLEYDKQSVTPLFEPGNYAEYAYASVHPEISATDATGNKIDNMMEDYHFQSATVKIAPTRSSALALMYEQPWGVDTKYPTGNMFNNSLGTTSAKVDTDSLTLLGGGKFDNNVWIFGGLSAQQAEGKVSAATPFGVDNATLAVLSQALPQAHLTPAQFQSIVTRAQAGQALTPIEQIQLQGVQNALNQYVPSLAASGTLYNLDIKKTTALVPVIGIGFEKPEIALKTSLTYRGKAKFDANTDESFSSEAIPQLNTPVISSGAKIEFPQSVNFDFQTGLSEKYRLLGMLNARWVNWKDFEVKPTLFGQLQNGASLVNYEKDQYSVEAALGKEFNPKLSGEVRVGYDSGTGEPLSPLGPYNSVKSLALGAQYKVTPALALSAGAQYSWLEGGDIVADGQKVGKADDGNAVSFGAKIGYHF